MPTHSRIQISFRNLRLSILYTICGLLIALGTLGAPGTARAEMELLMFEEPGCVWCRRWTEEVGDAYPVTPEGQAAPLRRLQLRDPLPEGIELVSAPRYTPTFVLIDDGTEVGRIEGYPGEDFFWGLLGRLLERATPSG
jgi:hypothetical protein